MAPATPRASIYISGTSSLRLSFEALQVRLAACFGRRLSGAAVLEWLLAVGRDELDRLDALKGERT